jgi:hypothetical protein
MHDKCITHLSESKQVLGLEQWVKKGETTQDYLQDSLEQQSRFPPPITK